MDYKKIGKFLLKLLVSLVFVAWLIRKIDWQQVLFYTRNISIFQIVLYIAVLLIGMAISAYKWQVLAEFKGFRFPLKNYFQYYLAGTFLNNFFPSFIGGDAYRAYQIGKQDKRYVASTAAVVMDRVTGLLGAMVLSVVFALLNWKVVSSHKVLLLIMAIVVVVLIGVACMGLIVKLPLWQKMARLASTSGHLSESRRARFVPKKILEVIKDFAEYEGSSAFNKSLVLAIIYSLVGLGLVNYVLFWALGIHVGVLNYLTVIFMISIVSSIPVSVNNIGIKEWAYVTFFGFFGISSAAVVTVSLVSRVLQMLVSFTALPSYLKSKK
ncbi:MAG TPA: lysylphosphatidylglycerol synthase transmembrane domain-containing protein [Patescibacteria group bacterium]